MIPVRPVKVSTVRMRRRIAPFAVVRPPPSASVRVAQHPSLRHRVRSWRSERREGGRKGRGGDLQFHDDLSGTNAATLGPHSTVTDSMLCYAIGDGGGYPKADLEVGGLPQHHFCHQRRRRGGS